MALAESRSGISRRCDIGFRSDISVAVRDHLRVGLAKIIEPGVYLTGKMDPESVSMIPNQCFFR